MYNRVILIGTIADRPKAFYDTNANRYVCILLKVSPPPDAPLTHWGGIYDLRNPDWPTGEDTFLVICREPLLVENVLKSFHEGDVVCIEGRLVLTLLNSDSDLVPVAEILASSVLVIPEPSNT
jgi:single-stranded DNA-binding protein